MKKVKACGECGFCNKWTRMNCSRCGNLIADVPITEVDDDLIEVPNFGLKERENGSEEENAKEERASARGQKEFRCKECGEINIFPPENGFVRCDKCRRIYYPADAEQLIVNREEQINPARESGLTADTTKSLFFRSILQRDDFVLTFTAERQLFGRENCEKDFIRNNKFISREHFRYFYRDGQAYVEDISTNGTFINGKRLIKGKEYALNVGDILKVSNEELIVKNAD